jgi:hypothetical protein
MRSKRVAEPGPESSHTLICLPPSPLFAGAVKSVWVPGATPVGPDCATRVVPIVSGLAAAPSRMTTSTMLCVPHVIRLSNPFVTAEEAPRDGAAPESEEAPCPEPILPTAPRVEAPPLRPWLGQTDTHHRVPRVPAQAATIPRTRPALETEFQRWNAFVPPAPETLAPRSRALTYDVYTPQSPRPASGRRASAPPPLTTLTPGLNASYVLHVGLVALGLTILLGTILAIVAVAGSERPPRSMMAADPHVSAVATPAVTSVSAPAALEPPVREEPAGEIRASHPPARSAKGARAASSRR